MKGTGCFWKGAVDEILDLVQLGRWHVFRMLMCDQRGHPEFFEQSRFSACMGAEGDRTVSEGEAGQRGKVWRRGSGGLSG